MRLRVAKKITQRSLCSQWLPGCPWRPGTLTAAHEKCLRYFWRHNAGYWRW